LGAIGVSFVATPKVCNKDAKNAERRFLLCSKELWRRQNAAATVAEWSNCMQIAAFYVMLKMERVHA
jgi:hypothetical protein